MKINQFIQEHGMTQAQLADRLGYSQNYVNQVANKRIAPTDAFRWRWQKAFGPETLWILNGDDHAI